MWAEMLPVWLIGQCWWLKFKGIYFHSQHLHGILWGWYEGEEQDLVTEEHNHPVQIKNSGGLWRFWGSECPEVYSEPFKTHTRTRTLFLSLSKRGRFFFFEMGQYLWTSAQGVWKCFFIHLKRHKYMFIGMLFEFRVYVSNDTCMHLCAEIMCSQNCCWKFAVSSFYIHTSCSSTYRQGTYGIIFLAFPFFIIISSCQLALVEID